MRYLTDTQAFLWFVLGDPRISPAAQGCMVNPANELLFSAASYWELAIKVSLGKYRLPTDFATFMRDQMSVNRLRTLPIGIDHAAQVATLPFHHKDPFDRLLVAQTIVENVPLISADSQLDRYGIQRLW